MPAFCRHNRFLANCPICSREQAAAAPAPAARPRSAGGGGTRSGSTVAAVRRPAHAQARPRGRRRLPLRPRRRIKATADAERLALAVAAAAARLEPPGPYEVVATEPDLEEATWLALLLALAGPDAPDEQAAVLDARPGWATGEAPPLRPEAARTAEAYRAWAGRAGSQEAAFTGEATWTPARRFSRLYDRLALPGFGRSGRYELLAILGARSCTRSRRRACTSAGRIRRRWPRSARSCPET
jgi:hypothetical protein